MWKRLRRDTASHNSFLITNSVLSHFATIPDEGTIYGVPDIKIDFSQVTYSSVLEIIAPIVPGGILAVGTLLLNPALASKLLSNPYLGYRSRLIAAIFISYTAGLLLNLFVNYVTYFIGFQIGYHWGSKLFPNPPKPWENLLWRKVARRFLGPELAPATDELYFKDLHDQKLNEANAIQDPAKKAAQLKFTEDFFGPKRQAEWDWYWWYQVLGKYFAKPDVWAAPWQYFLAMMHTSSWAVILLMVFNHRYHWLAWALCVTGLFFGNGVSWFSNETRNDPHAINQTATLFRNLKHPTDSDTKGHRE